MESVVHGKLVTVVDTAAVSASLNICVCKYEQVRQ